MYERKIIKKLITLTGSIRFFGKSSVLLNFQPNVLTHSTRSIKKIHFHRRRNVPRSNLKGNKTFEIKFSLMGLMNLLPCEVKKKINSEFHLVLFSFAWCVPSTCVFRYHLEYRDNFSFSDIFNLRLQLTLQSERNTQLSAIQITTEQHHRSSQSSPLWSSRPPSSTETKLQPNRREKKIHFMLLTTLFAISARRVGNVKNSSSSSLTAMPQLDIKITACVE